MNQDSDNWDAHWEWYAKTASKNPAQIYRQKLMLRLLRENGANRDMRLLDMGSGQGDFLARVRQAWPQAALCGFEMSAIGAAITREKIAGVSVVVADILQPPAEAEHFCGWATDAVCSEVLEHVDDPVEFLKAARRYLAPGAFLIATVPGGPMSAFDRHIGHRQHFNRRNVRAMLEAAGFAVKRVYLAGFPFFNVYRSVVIARGDKLVEDVREGNNREVSVLARATMAAFLLLFRFNLIDSPVGWQVIAVAQIRSVDEKGLL
jgi:SAM-dependent methyltransferase